MAEAQTSAGLEFPVDLGIAPTEASVSLLARNGWLAETGQLIAKALNAGDIDAAEAAQLKRTLAAQYRETPVRNHQLFGILDDSVVSSLQFSELSEPAEMRESFRQAVRWIEIETSSQCNRRCSYCPNHEYDRRTGNNFLDEEFFARLLSDLREIDYDGWIKLVGNNEFFLHEKNLWYLAEARKQLPRARLQLFSNGDVLTRKWLDRIAEHRPEKLLITLHQPPKQPYADLETLQRAWTLSRKLDLPFQLKFYDPGIRLEFGLHYRGIDTLIHNADFEAVGHDWATFFAERRHADRVAPCSYPLRQLIFNYEGDSFMCCRSFKDAVPQTIEAGALTGHLAEFPSIFHLYGNPAHLRWRQQLMTTEPKSGPCRQCDGDEPYLLPAAQNVLKVKDLWTAKIRST